MFFLKTESKFLFMNKASNEIRVFLKTRKYRIEILKERKELQKRENTIMVSMTDTF